MIIKTINKTIKNTVFCFLVSEPGFLKGLSDSGGKFKLSQRDPNQQAKQPENIGESEG